MTMLKKVTLTLIIFASQNLVASVRRSGDPSPPTPTFKQVVNFTKHVINEKFNRNSLLVGVGAGMVTGAASIAIEQGHLAASTPAQNLALATLPLVSLLALTKTTDRLFTSYSVRSAVGAAGTFAAGNFFLKAIQSPATHPYSIICGAAATAGSLYYCLRNLDNYLEQEDATVRRGHNN